MKVMLIVPWKRLQLCIGVQFVIIDKFSLILSVTHHFVAVYVEVLRSN